MAVIKYKDNGIWVPVAGGSGGSVNSVNGQTGTVVLDATDVGALDDSTVIPAQKVWYSANTQAGNTATYTITTTDGNFTKTDGNIVNVLFTYSRTSAGGSMNVDGTGAADMMYANGTAITAQEWQDKNVVQFVYKNDQFIVVKGGRATTMYYGVTRLSSSTTSTAEDLAATPKAVKTVNDAIPTVVSSLTNDAGYTTNTGTVTSVRVQATSPVASSVSTAQSSSLDTTISLADAYGDTKNPYGSKTKNYVLAAPSSANGAPSFRALVAGDIPDLSGIYSTTDEKLAISSVTNNTTYYPILADSTTTASTRQYISNIQVTNSPNSSGSGYVRVQIGNTATSNGAKGLIRFGGGQTTYYIDLMPQTLSGNRTIYLPNANGTLALTTDIPTIPTNVSSFTNDAGYITSSALNNYVPKHTETGSGATLKEGIINNSNGDVYISTYCDEVFDAGLECVGDTTNSTASAQLYATDGNNTTHLTITPTGTTISSGANLYIKDNNSTGTGLNIINSNDVVTGWFRILSDGTLRCSTVENGSSIAGISTNSDKALIAFAGGQNIYFRPNGVSSSTGQVDINSSGDLILNRYIIINNNAGNTSSDYARIEFKYNNTTYAWINTSGDGALRVTRVEDTTSVAGLYCPTSGTAYLFGKNNNVFLRPNGTSDSSGQFYVDTTGNIHVTGQQIGGHPLTRTSSTTAKSITASTVTNLLSVTNLVSSGVYLINCLCRFTPSASTAGYFYLGVSATNGTTAPGYRQTCWTASTARKDINYTYIVEGQTAQYMNFYSTVAGSVGAMQMDIVRLS